MSKLTRDDVQNIAGLARLQLTPEETDSFTDQLGAIIDYVAKLNEVDISAAALEGDTPVGEEPTDAAWREDVTQPSLGQKKAVERAPDANRGYFRVPKVIGG